MKSLYHIKNHIKISLGLFVLLVTIILTSLVEKQNLKIIDQSFSSIFADRLIPATDIFFITDQLYERRLQLQSFLLAPEGAKAHTPELKGENNFIDSLLNKYEDTYLVENEVVCLKGLLEKWEQYKTQEETILTLAGDNQQAEAIALFNATENNLFKSMIMDLHLLTKIQSQVGQDLTQVSKSNISSSNSIFDLQFGITIIIALVCNGFLFARKVMQQPFQKFNLN